MVRLKRRKPLRQVVSRDAAPWKRPVVEEAMASNAVKVHEEYKTRTLDDADASGGKLKEIKVSRGSSQRRQMKSNEDNRQPTALERLKAAEISILKIKEAVEDIGRAIGDVQRVQDVLVQAAHDVNNSPGDKFGTDFVVAKLNEESKRRINQPYRVLEHNLDLLVEQGKLVLADVVSLGSGQDVGSTVSLGQRGEDGAAKEPFPVTMHVSKFAPELQLKIAGKKVGDVVEYEFEGKKTTCEIVKIWDVVLGALDANSPGMASVSNADAPEEHESAGDNVLMPYVVNALTPSDGATE